MVRKPRSAESPENAASRPAASASGDTRDVFYRSADGLLLHARVHGDAVSPWLPVVCLPGLTRTTRDFDDLARFLSTDRRRPRRVIAFDYRGRGQSAWDAKVENYNALTEMTDVLDGMAALAVPRAVVVGTSRGGIIGMLIAVARPAVLAGLILNDVGPVLEPHGLARIKTYVGRTPPPDDWADAVAILKRLHGAQFPGFDEDDWMAYARATYRDVDGRPAADNDPALARTLDGFEFDRPIPTLWPQFAALAQVPVLVVRGEQSDMLAPVTVAAMAAAHPRLESVTMEGEGHPPSLRRPALQRRISAFIAGIEGAGPPAEAVVPRDPPLFDLDAPRPADPAP